MERLAGMGLSSYLIFYLIHCILSIGIFYIFAWLCNFVFEHSEQFFNLFVRFFDITPRKPPFLGFLDVRFMQKKRIINQGKQGFFISPDIGAAQK